MAYFFVSPSLSLSQGLAGLASAPWHDALAFLLSAAPLSAEDCQIWLELLPLLQRLLTQEGALPHPQLLSLAEQFASGSALTWLQRQHEQPGGEAQGSWAAQAALALQPAVLHTTRLIVGSSQRAAAGQERQELLAAARPAAWLQQLGHELQHGGYTSRVAALRLAAALVGAMAEHGGSGGCTEPVALDLMNAAIRRVLMPRELWSTAHRHGKAAVLEALQLLLAITRAVPAPAWSEAWAGIGTTYWLSRTASDSDPHVREAAVRLLAAAVAAPATNTLLRQAWPECGDVAASMVLDESEPADVRAAALGVVAAALSQGMAQPCSVPVEQQRQQPAHHRTASGTPADEEDATDGVICSGEQLALAPLLPSIAAECVLGTSELWDAAAAILQVSGAFAGDVGFPLANKIACWPVEPLLFPACRTPIHPACSALLLTLSSSMRCWTQWVLSLWSTAAPWCACWACQLRRLLPLEAAARRLSRQSRPPTQAGCSVQCRRRKQRPICVPLPRSWGLLTPGRSWPPQTCCLLWQEPLVWQLGWRAQEWPALGNQRHEACSSAVRQPWRPCSMRLLCWPKAAAPTRQPAPAARSRWQPLSQQR